MKVSIIVPTYNHEGFIGYCLRSVKEQTYENFECIIVDDCSADRTVEVIAPFLRDDRFRLIRRPVRGGPYRLAELYNEALSKSTGQLIAILEGDDFWPKDKLEKQVRLHMSSPEVYVSWGRALIVDEKGNVIGDTGRPRAVTFRGKTAYRRLLFRNFIPSVTVMIRADVLKRQGFLAVKNCPTTDYPTLVWLSYHHPNSLFCWVDELLGFYRRHSGQVSRNRWAMRLGQLSVYKWLYKQGVISLPLLTVLSAWALGCHIYKSLPSAGCRG